MQNVIHVYEICKKITFLCVVTPQAFGYFLSKTAMSSGEIASKLTQAVTILEEAGLEVCWNNIHTLSHIPIGIR